MNQTMHRGRLAPQSKFEPQAQIAAQNEAPVVNAAHIPAEAAPIAPPLTLHDELRAAMAQADRYLEQETAIRTKVQTLATQRDQLASKAAQIEREIAEARGAHVAALLAGTPAPKSTAAALEETRQAIAAGQEAIAQQERAAEAELHNCFRLRNEHERNVIGDVRWRIALGRYAAKIAEALPLVRELGELSRIHGRSFAWGQGLVLNAHGYDIVGVPLADALRLADNLGE
ncbi:MAG: hypothetical protein KGN16_10350 [Burkholderiales bacterium]|nr:hypothetical protein [Burkholderiales bacterium]